MNISERLETVNARIRKAANSVGRPVEEISLIVVSKTHQPDVVRQAIEAGVSDLGENRVQEAESKIREIGHECVRWHLIGHLQANKARRAVQLFDVIHTLDTPSLALRLDRLCREEFRDVLPVLIQVDLGCEAAKSGAGEGVLPELVRAIKSTERLRLIGLMTVPPFFEDTEFVRPFYHRLRHLRDEFQMQGVFGTERGALSMGMSHDFEVAIQEGATMIRVGTAIFGERERQAVK